MAHVENESAPWHRMGEGPTSHAENQAHAVNQLRDWWLEQTENEIMAVVPKAIEYGSADLDIIGYAMSKFARQSDFTTNDELGIAFYILGKVARLVGAYSDGSRPSDDTWFDIAIYTKMAQRARAVGSWPGVELK